MSLTDRVVDAITDYSKAAIAVMLVVTVLVGAGAAQVEQTSSLDQFQSDTPEAADLDYIDQHFSTGAENTTTAQIIVRGENVLSNETLIETLEYQQTLRDNETINQTLAAERPTTGVANAIATAAIQQERAAELQATLAEFRQLNATVQEQRSQLQAQRATLQENQTEFNQTREAVATRASELNATAERLKQALTTLRENPTADIREEFDAVAQRVPVTLNESHYATFQTAAQNLRNATDQESIQAASELGTQGVLSAEYQALMEQRQSLEAWGQALQERGAALQEQAVTLQEQGQRLEALGGQLQEQRAAIENVSAIGLDEQIDQLAAMNESQLESTIALVLGDGDNGGGSGVLGLMSSEYERGSTTAKATMVLVTQQTDEAVAPGGTVSDRIVDSQLAMQDLGADFDGEYLVFGSGLITDEINRSMSDSMLIVGPLALLFVLGALAIGYRDILDIVLGLFGIGAVLVWTFGFMGWADISFNQIFIAVPVLLIGLSIDYAIHIFMRHRERRSDEDRGPREAMRVALGGVGVALTLVTATTVIGFLSNLTSPVPPIREFGIVSGVGIVAALLVFGVLIPALKIELDEFLEGHGIDRRKRAIGTEGGRLSQALKLGSIGARKAPYMIIVAALLLSAGGAYAGSQVDTSFSQEDFLAEDPPGWMEELPEPFKPGEYTAKSNLEYVNERFVREDSQAQLLIRGDVATANGIANLSEARTTLGEQDVTQKLPGGEPDVQSALSVIETVAAENETFNATLAAADTDGDGVPDENVAGVYDTLYEVAPQQAQSVLYRENGEYAAARIVVSIQGSASSSDVTAEMRSVAESLSGDGLETTATGQTIRFDIVQDQLLETVIQSLLITLVAVFAFLMVVYRISDGSATLGFVTLLPVVLSVAWILGTMYAFEIPFNVMTGMITSLTVGLGVAYSIHLSERFNQELEATGSTWEALDRAVTGTGGALLGSAATTVGGFGVLVFAILPPLKQFGLITGLTIIYAFLASVLVLPSLLVVWTRLFGPEDAFDDGSGGSADGDTDDGPMGSTDATAPRVERDLAPGHVAPGGVVAVTLSVENPPERLAIRERMPGTDLAIYAVTPEPTEYVAQGSTVVAAFEDVTERIVLEYDATIDPETADDSTLSIDGRVLADEDVSIQGPASVTVVTDVVDRVLAAGQVTDEDLQVAADHFATGQLSAEAFEGVCELWVDTDDE